MNEQERYITREEYDILMQTLSNNNAVMRQILDEMKQRNKQVDRRLSELQHEVSELERDPDDWWKGGE
jgi:hypothetical protein